MARLWRLIGFYIQGMSLDRDWDTVNRPLQIAASIESVVANTGFVDQDNLCYNKMAVEFEEYHSNLTSRYVKELTIFIWTWIAYENTVKILFKEKQNIKIGKYARELIKEKTNFHRLYGMELLEKRALKILQCNEFQQIFPELYQKIMRRVQIPIIEGENEFLYMDICRETRNYFVHGDADIPTPRDWGEGVEYDIDKDELVVFIGLNIQLILFTIQILLCCKYYNMVNEEDSINLAPDLPEFDSINQALTMLHLDLDVDQMFFDF